MLGWISENLSTIILDCGCLRTVFPRIGNTFRLSPKIVTPLSYNRCFWIGGACARKHSRHAPPIFECTARLHRVALWRCMNLNGGGCSKITLFLAVDVLKMAVHVDSPTSTAKKWR